MLIRNQKRASHLNARHRDLFYQVLDHREKETVSLRGKNLISFCSFGVLGFQHSKVYLNAYSKAFNDFGNHSGSARIFYEDRVCGELEDLIASCYCSESAVVFPSTSIAHLSILPQIASLKHNLIVCKQSHMSIHNALQFAQVEPERVRYIGRNSTENEFYDIAKSFPDSQPVVFVCDSLYGIDGVIENLEVKSRPLKELNGYYYLDDSHATGLYGDRGMGLGLSALRKMPQSIIIGSFAKALGAYGSFGVMSRQMKDMLKWNTSVNMFTGPLPTPCLYQCKSAWQLCLGKFGEKKRNILRSNVNHFLSLSTKRRSDAHIFFVKNSNALEMCAKLFDNGILVNPILFPAVGKGLQGVRIVISTFHSINSLEKLHHLLESGI